MNILIAIVVGGFIGWIASKLMKTGKQMGLIANVVVGIVGSSLGTHLAPTIGLVPEDGIGRFLVGVGGAVLLIWLLKVLKIFK
ncbi:MAG: GlsB/YeaQ/YmgE family stress response membrane protein [Planctomycetota bacterium]|nr:GlsB/YeaQ/YmgE family stress response membrane protein [Planctomycetota bacterium]